MDTQIQFFPVFVFIIVAILFTLMPVVIAYLLSPRTKGDKTFVTYECGIEPFGSAWVRYSSHYYIYALIFIAFDVDILYLFPAALSLSLIHISEPTRLLSISYAVFCLQKKKKNKLDRRSGPHRVTQ